MKTKFAFVYHTAENHDELQQIDASTLRKAFKCKKVNSLELRGAKPTKASQLKNPKLERKDNWTNLDYFKLWDLNVFLNNVYDTIYQTKEHEGYVHKALFVFSDDAISTNAFFKFTGPQFFFFRMDKDDLDEFEKLSTFHNIHSRLTEPYWYTQDKREDILTQLTLTTKEQEFLRSGALKLEQKIITTYDKMFKNEISRLKEMLSNGWD
jgi:hypothetical protein